MEITAKLTQLLPVQTGTGKNGPWKKREIIVETEGQYPRKVCIALWGAMAEDDHLLKINDKLTIHFNLESREYNNRWYTEVKAWKIILDETTAPTRTVDVIRFDGNSVIDKSDLPF